MSAVGYCSLVPFLYEYFVSAALYVPLDSHFLCAQRNVPMSGPLCRGVVNFFLVELLSQFGLTFLQNSLNYGLSVPLPDYRSRFTVLGLDMIWSCFKSHRHKVLVTETA